MGACDFVGTIGSGWFSDRIRQSRSAVRLLRPARPVAALPAGLFVLDLRPVAVRGFLRPGLGRDRAADGAPDRRGVRSRTRRRGVRLDLRRAYGGRGVRRLRRRLFARRAAILLAGPLRRRRAQHVNIARHVTAAPLRRERSAGTATENWPAHSGRYVQLSRDRILPQDTALKGAAAGGKVDAGDLDDGLPRGFLAGAIVEVWVAHRFNWACELPLSRGEELP